jgi:hypothetical protein
MHGIIDWDLDLSLFTPHPLSKAYIIYIKNI